MEFREYFEFDPQMIHLNNAGASALPLKARQRLKLAADEVGRGAAQVFPTWGPEMAQAREAFASFLHTTANRIAFTSNLATAMSMVAWGLPFRRGDVILTLDQEYPSNAYPWLGVAKSKDLTIQVHASHADFSVDWTSFLEQIRPGVRAVVLSWVQFMAGTTAPLQLIGEACRSVGAWLVVDVIQGLGIQPFDNQRIQADVICGGSHKWMCGPTGVGFLAFRDDLFLQMEPLLRGAMTYGTPNDTVDSRKPPRQTAGRFEPGSLPDILILTLAQSLAVLTEFGIDRIHAQAFAAAENLRRELSARGWKIWGDPPGQRTSPIVTFAGAGIAEVSRKLEEAKISHAFRRQSVRLSPHGFNTANEIARALETVGRP